jgi:NAD(P)-dependent dehydrogenase (short-subunit alcohol dehydrogenase family)
MPVVQRPDAATLQAALVDKVAIVTGAASGIGQAIATLYAEYGATVILSDINALGVKTAAEAIGGKAVAFPCDVSSWTQQLSLFEFVMSQYGKLDILVANAGYAPECLTAGEDDDPVTINARGQVQCNFLAEEMEIVEGKQQLKAPVPLVWETNIRGGIYGVKLALHYMRGAGNIILTGSVGSYLGIGGNDMYTLSKHALLGLMRATTSRPDVASRPISISLLCPHKTDTPMISMLAKSRSEGVPTSQPEDVAWAAAWFVSAPKEKTNGKSLWVQETELMEVEEEYLGWLFPHIRATGWEWKGDKEA